uniref:Ig-like domain-containing protein n=1 Tax=Strigops habroptila TaxID=2489341 RepID=A0A672UPY7_STRHB
EPISIGCLAKDFFPTPISITWVSEVDGDNETFPIQLIGSSYSVSSQLTISSSVKGETFQCQVDHSITQSRPKPHWKGPSPPPLTFSPPSSIDTTAKAPSVYVLPPPADELVLQETATLTCLATGFSPKDILVTWTQQDRPVSSESFSTFGPKAEGDAFTVYSMLKVPVDEWQRGDTFSCVVGHDGIPLTFIQKNLDKTLGKPTMVNVSVVLSDSETAPNGSPIPPMGSDGGDHRGLYPKWTSKGSRRRDGVGIGNEGGFGGHFGRRKGLEKDGVGKRVGNGLKWPQMVGFGGVHQRSSWFLWS